MDGKPSRYERAVPMAAGWIVFMLALVYADWLIYAGSIVIFRLDPTAVPEGFHVVLAAPKPDGPGIDYVPAGWTTYTEAKAERRVQTYLLPQPAGSIPGPKTSFSFAVLEDGGARQFIEVRSTGLHSSVSRYEASADRVLPVGYGSITWRFDEKWNFAVFMLTVVVAGLLAGIAAFSVNRLLRWQKNQTN